MARRFPTPRVAAAVGLAVVLAGCAGVKVPEYQRPETPGKAAWSRQAPSAEQTISRDWWKEFNDPYLNQLVDQAIAGNLDLAVLAARTGVAEASIGQARAGALPSVTGSASASFQKGTSGEPLSRQFSASAQVNWEIDIWGKVAKGVQAQKAEFRATEADWRAGYLTLVSDLSTAYFQICQFDEQIERQQRALDKSKQILAIYESMEKNGLAPKTQVERQRAEINALAHDLIELRRRRDLNENAVATLLGVAAGEYKVPPQRLQDKVKVPAVPVGLPSQLLARRPDIVAAEFRVLEAYDLVGQARLAQLPSISLTGSGGVASLALSTLLKSFTFGFAPSITLPMFDPSIKARAKVSEAEAKVAEQQYRKAVVAAFEDVENALVNLEAHKKQRAELEQQTERLKMVDAQIQAQLKEGLVSQLDVFENERSLLAAQQALLANYQQILADTVTLYKALGGGWAPVDVKERRE